MYNAFENAAELAFGEWKAVVLPHFGMNVVSLRRGEKRILREPENFEALKNSPYLHGIPLLFPANRTSGGTFSFEGNAYSLPLNEPARNNHIHGLMFNAPFTVTEKNVSSVEAVFENVSERYPFPFKMTIRDTLSQSGYSRTLLIENTGKTAFPYTLAFHTAFVSPETFTAPVLKRYSVNECFIPTGESVPLTENEKTYLTGAHPENQKISGFFAAGGHTVTLDETVFKVSQNFDEWILFNGGGGQGFFCAEPQAGQVNGLNMPEGHLTLSPGETEAFTLNICRKEL